MYEEQEESYLFLCFQKALPLHVLYRKLSEMLRLVCESKDAASRIAEVLELMSAHAHKQVFQSSLSSFLRLKYVGQLKTPFVY